MCAGSGEGSSSERYTLLEKQCVKKKNGPMQLPSNIWVDSARGLLQSGHVVTCQGGRDSARDRKNS